MTTIDSLRGLFRHMDWADAVVWRAVLDSPAARADARTRERLQHLHMVQRAFLSVWRNRPFDPEEGKGLDAPALAAWARDTHREVAAWLETAGDGDLDRPVILPWAGFVAGGRTENLGVPVLGETMIQVTAHSSYHRGQINARLRELGVEPPLVDYIAWIWFGKPAAEWEPDPV